MTDGLTAHHIRPFIETQSYDPADGVALCLPHHREADRRLAAMSKNLDTGDDRAA